MVVEKHMTAHMRANGPSNSALTADADNRFENSLSFLERVRIAQVISIDRVAQTMQIDVLDDKTQATVPYFGFFTSSSAGTGLWYGIEEGDLVICAVGASNNYVIFIRNTCPLEVVLPIFKGQVFLMIK